jgi:hypothetical protein
LAGFVNEAKTTLLAAKAMLACQKVTTVEN